MNRDANELPTIIAELEDGLRTIESIQCVGTTEVFNRCFDLPVVTSWNLLGEQSQINCRSCIISWKN